jgi:hypothetical protein
MTIKVIEADEVDEKEVVKYYAKINEALYSGPQADVVDIWPVIIALSEMTATLLALFDDSERENRAEWIATRICGRAQEIRERVDERGVEVPIPFEIPKIKN